MQAIKVARPSFLAALLVIAGLLLLFVLRCGREQNRMAGSSDTQQSGHSASADSLLSRERAASGLTEAQKKYFQRAFGYIDTLNQQDIELAKTMAGASTGESTLSMIKNAIQHARFIENVRYSVDYGPVPVPQEFAQLDSKIRDCHRLHDAALEELLEYWNDQNIAHIESGFSSLQRTALLTNECIAQLSAKIDEVTANSESRRSRLVCSTGKVVPGGCSSL